MGYTHYWKIVRPVPPPAWAQLVDDTRALIDHARRGDVAVRGWDGAGDPEIGDTLIALNGDAATGQDFESFVLEPVVTTGPCPYVFCKTARRPYDVLVAAILARAVHHLGEHIILAATDGDAADWSDAARLLARAFPGERPDVCVPRIVARRLETLVKTAPVPG